MIKDLQAFDAFEMGLTQRRTTPEGFLEAPANIARSGVQMYRAKELGLDKHGIAGDRVIKLHRPDEELFDPNVIQSFDNLPVITGTHTTVNSGNWKDLAAGDVHGPARNGKLLNVGRMTVRDKSAIDDVNSGKKYLSIGYKFDLDMTPGLTAEGEQYDGRQVNLRPNHVLITDKPRGGTVCAIADSTDEHSGERKMKKITVDGIPVEVGDSEAGIIETLITQRDAARNQQPSVTYSIGDRSKTITGGDALVKELTGKDTAIAELTAKVLSPEQLEKLVNDRAIERAQVIGDSSKMVADFKPEAKTNTEIRREVIEKVTAGDAEAKTLVTAVLSGKTIGDASDDQLTVAFNALTATVHSHKGVNGADSAVASALTSKKDNVTSGDTSSKPVGRAAFIERQKKAWQGTEAN